MKKNKKEKKKMKEEENEEVGEKKEERMYRENKGQREREIKSISTEWKIKTNKQ
jgi:hypothetical protein